MSTTNVTITGLVVPPLTDNTVWFANAAAWNSYWLSTGFAVTFNIAGVGTYGLVQQGNTGVYTPPATTNTKRYTLQLDLDGSGNLQNVPVPDAGSFDEVKTLLASLLADYQALKLALKNAGVVNNN